MEVYQHFGGPCSHYKDGCRYLTTTLRRVTIHKTSIWTP